MPAPVLQFKRGNAGVAGTVPALRPGEPAISLNNFDFFIGIDTSVVNNKFFGSHRYWGREDGTTSLRLKLVDKDGSNYVAVKTPDTLAGIVTYTLPGVQGASSSVLTNDGSGNLTWASGSANPTFTGVATFTGTDDNILGNPDSGAVQIDGGLGVNKNVTVGGNLNVQGYSEFVGVATFKGGTINLGDSTGDDINVGGEFISGLFPNTTATYDLGDQSRQWRHGNFSGIVTASTGAVIDGVQIGINGQNVIDTVSGDLTINSAGGQTIIDDAVTIQNNLTVNGNVTVGGTTITLKGQDVFIENKDIVLGFTTSITPNDTTANHAGVAIASTEGTPLVSFSASGINTLPDTYKQLMWFKSGTLGFATDAFAFNYGVAIGTTTMADGVRLAVGSGITMSDTEISATTFTGAFNGNASSADQVKTVTASNTNATYHITFVDANNGSATNETVYTDDGIYYNPGTNTFTTQHALFTGNVEIQGTITGTATTATRATTVDTTGTSTNADYYVTFVDTLAGQTGETLRVGAGLSVNPSDGSVKTKGILSVGNPGDLTSYIKAGGGSNALYLYADGQVSFQNKAIVNEIRSASNSSTLITLSGLDATFANNVYVTGITTVGSDLVVGGDVRINGNDIKSSTGATAITLSDNDVTVADDLTVQGNLYVNGSTTQVNSTALTVEDRTIELGKVDGATTSTTTWDLGVLFNYGDAGTARKSAVIWEHADSRFKFAKVLDSDSDGTNANTPQLTITGASNYAAIEINALWINDCAGQSQVISCTGAERLLENITIDAGTF